MSDATNNRFYREKEPLAATSEPPITAEEVMQWGNSLWSQHAFTWFAQVLNGEYSVADARADCLSIVRPKPAEEGNG